MTEKPIRPLRENEAKLAEFVVGQWFVDVDQAAAKQQIKITVADFFRPEFWHASVKQLKPGDKIRLLSRAENYDFEVAVAAVCQDGVVCYPHPRLPASPEAMRADAITSQKANQEALRAKVFAPRKPDAEDVTS